MLRDHKDIIAHFPFFTDQTEKLYYLDSAATSQKTKAVIDRVCQYYAHENANVHRGIYRLGDDLTTRYEDVRKNVAAFIGVKDERQIVFTSGTTDAINLVASGLAKTKLKKDDEILLSRLEHHANIVPWQLAAESVGAVIRYIPMTDESTLDLKAAESLISKKTKVLALSHVSNVLGVINPVKKLIEMAKNVGAVTLIDGAQAVPHFAVDMCDLDCDFYTFSGHKIMAPTGIGVLYGRMSCLEELPPFRGGGNMIFQVKEQSSSWNVVPSKFEAGTPHIAGVIGLGTAIEFLETLDRPYLMQEERRLSSIVQNELNKDPNIKLYSYHGEDSIGTIAFAHEQIHPHDMASICDSHNVCIRAGHHCAQLLMGALETPALSRVSFYIYNNESDVDQFLSSYHEAKSIFS